jgi:hypothetical protein
VTPRRRHTASHLRDVRRQASSLGPQAPNSQGPQAPIADQVDSLDEQVFAFIESQTTEWDRRSLLALHSAAAQTLGSFSYLEIGSFWGGSLQAVMRDPRCAHVTSIDPRPAQSPDARGPDHTYEQNTTDHMLDLLRRIPDVDMNKISTLDQSTDSLRAAQLPVRPDYCFIDGEHTNGAVLRDARFCAQANGGVGLIAFHDYTIVGEGIRAFLREAWSDVSYAVAFTGNVFAVELGGGGILRSEVVDRAISSKWHSLTWRMVSRTRSTPVPFLLAWSAMPRIDAWVVDSKDLLLQTRQRLPRARRRD